LVFCAGIVLMALYGIAGPSLQSIMTRQVLPTEQGQLQGAQGSLMGVASTVAPLLFTQVFAAGVGRFRDLGAPGIPFFLAAVMLLAALKLARREGDRWEGQKREVACPRAGTRRDPRDRCAR